VRSTETLDVLSLLFKLLSKLVQSHEHDETLIGILKSSSLMKCLVLSRVLLFPCVLIFQTNAAYCQVRLCCLRWTLRHPSYVSLLRYYLTNHFQSR
jgi:hypothetical protein